MCFFYVRSRKSVSIGGFELETHKRWANFELVRNTFFFVSSASELAKRRHANSTTSKKNVFLQAHGDNFTIIGPQESLSLVRRAQHQCVRLENEVRVLHRTLQFYY